MKKKIDPKDPATWPDDYRGCGVCNNFGSRDKNEVKKHLKDEHDKTVK